MNKKVFLVLVLTLLLVFSVSIAFADETDIDGDYPWRGHAAPLDFKFGNMIDSHQQSFTNGLVKDDEDQYVCPDLSKCTLKGFIYIQPTGLTNEEFGVLEAKKADCTDPESSCIVGWVVKGVWVEGVKLVNKSPRIWLIDEDQIPEEPGYSHFQWVGGPLKPHGLKIYGEDGIYKTYSGYLMKRIAPAPFFWLGGSGSGGMGGSGGCGGHETGDGCSDGEHEEGGCSGGSGSGSGGMGGSPGGGCSEGDTGCTDGGHDDGGCTDGGDEGGCSGGGEDDGCGGGDEGGCGGSGGDHGGGSPGRYVSEGVDSHSNIVTVWDGTWHGGCSHD